MFHFSQFLKILKEILYYLLSQSLVEWHLELHNTLDLLHEHKFVLHPLQQLQRTNPCPEEFDCAVAIVRKATQDSGSSSSL